MEEHNIYNPFFFPNHCFDLVLFFDNIIITPSFQPNKLVGPYKLHYGLFSSIHYRNYFSRILRLISNDIFTSFDITNTIFSILFILFLLIIAICIIFNNIKRV